MYNRRDSLKLMFDSARGIDPAGFFIALASINWLQLFSCGARYSSRNAYFQR